MQKESALVVDVGARVLRREGHEIHLAPKAFDLLLILVKNQRSTVPHEQLHAALWPGIHVSETSLAALVTQLRKAIGDNPDGTPMILTKHRVGYAFVGDVAVVGHVPIVASPICRLVWHGKSIDVPAGESVIGRDRACAIQIDAESVSRHHARLTTTGREMAIEDLGSKNGTWVGGERIRGAVPLADGTSFRLGSETLHVELAGDDRPTKTTPQC